MLAPDFVRLLGQFMAEKIDAAVAPFAKRIEDQERELRELRQASAAWRDDISETVTTLIGEALKAMPSSPRISSAHINRDGHLLLIYDNGGSIVLGPIVGRDGVDGKNGATREEIIELIKQGIAEIPKPKDGRDGLGFKDMSFGFDGERNVTFRFALEDHSEEFVLALCHPIYRGVWREGFYARGDCVTRDGSTWIAMKNTETTPGHKDCDWQLACKRGQNGSQGERGERGKPGENGRDGRDLTANYDGAKKWA